ncbi:peroxisomal biogenesis factor 19-like [Lineus longissimus]|uniref:peroxisomal biogenesis factor 19-like n=1 Tax=Lineus longissimus TaxID=88925 RepID=UPI002B4D1C76
MEDSEINSEKIDQNLDQNHGSGCAKTSNHSDVAEQIEPELDDLLDDALRDFDKPPVVATSNDSANHGEAAAASSGKESLGLPGASAALPPDQEAMFNDIFRSSELGDETSKSFEEAMKALMTEDPNMYEQLSKLSQAANSVSDTNDGNDDSQKEFFGTLQETLGSLAMNAQDLQGELSEDDLAKAMSSLGIDFGADGPGQGQGQDGDFLPMMQTMMKSLLSKDILYPSLKEISQKYPAWLDENKETVEREQYKKYMEQYRLMKDICAQLEQETEDDDDDVKKQRFEKVLGLMQQMQECGQPPPDIVGEMAPGLEFDENGIPKLPGASEQCCVM